MLNSLPSILGTGAPPAPLTDFVSIQTVTVGAIPATSISFTSIPSTYSHLQIRGTLQSNRAVYGIESLGMQVGNGSVDTGNNYSFHILEGSGSAVSALGVTSTSSIQTDGLSAASSNMFGGIVIDILDYANTHKYKTTRLLAGSDYNGTIAGYGGYIAFSSGLWQSTNAINTITLTPTYGTAFNQYSSLALYGVK